MLSRQNFTASSTTRDMEYRNIKRKSLFASGHAVDEELDLLCGTNVFRAWRSKEAEGDYCDLRDDFCPNPLALTFQPDHQRHLQLELSAGFCNAVGYNGTVHDPTKYVYKYCFHLQERNRVGNRWGFCLGFVFLFFLNKQR